MDNYLSISVSFDRSRKRAVFVGSFYSSMDPMRHYITLEYDGNAFYFIPTGQDSTGHPFTFGITGYDSNINRIVFYGAQQYGSPAETWEYDGCIWRQIQSANTPSIEWKFIGLTEVQEIGGLVVVSESDSGNTTWVYSIGQWHRVSLGDQISNRLAGLMSFDYSRHALEFYGGLDLQTGDWLDQIWELQCVQHCKPISRP